MTAPSATTGPRLKAERERRGLSLQKAADELHLDGWIIDALEADDYERIGPSVYAKGHLKRYAALLGLPSAEIMAGYESRAQAPSPPASQPANVRLRTDAPAVSNLPWPLIAGSVAAVLLLVVGVLWWRPWHQRGPAPVVGETLTAHPTAASADSATDSAVAVITSADASTTMSPITAPPVEAAAPRTARATASSSEADATAGVGRARLRLSFSADSWVDVHDAAGRRVFAGNGRANSVRTIAGIAPMRVYLGFASGVQLEINSRAIAIGPQFLAGDVARFEAGADGVLRRDSHSVVTPGAATPGVATPGVAAPSAPTRGVHPSG
jgi:cytoskeleton protein RodZ